MAFQSLSCGKSDADVAYEFTNNLANTLSRSSVLWGLVSNCATKMKAASNDFALAGYRVEKGAYDLAKKFTDNLEILYDECLDFFYKNPRLPLPHEMEIGVRRVRTDSDFVVAILSNI